MARPRSPHTTEYEIAFEEDRFVSKSRHGRADYCCAQAGEVGMCSQLDIGIHAFYSALASVSSEDTRSEAQISLVYLLVTMTLNQENRIRAKVHSENR